MQQIDSMGELNYKRVFKEDEMASHFRWFGCAMVFGAMIGSAQAAPFCFSSQTVPPQCMYYDAAQCQRESVRQGGSCVANPKEFRVDANIGQYCVVTTQRASLCIYLDRRTCEIDANAQHGACIYAPQRAASGAPDPYPPFSTFNPSEALGTPKPANRP